MVALGILVAPLVLFGLFHKTRLHFIGIEYKRPETAKGLVFCSKATRATIERS